MRPQAETAAVMPAAEDEGLFRSAVKSSLKWIANRLIDRNLTPPPPQARKVYSTAPPLHPDSMKRSLGTEGQPVLNHGKGW